MYKEINQPFKGIRKPFPLWCGYFINVSCGIIAAMKDPCQLSQLLQTDLTVFFHQHLGTRYWLILLLSPPEPFLWLYKIVKNMRTRCVSTPMTKSVIYDKTGHQRTTGLITTCKCTTSMENPLTMCHNVVDTPKSWQKYLERSERFTEAGSSWKGMENVKRNTGKSRKTTGNS